MMLEDSGSSLELPVINTDVANFSIMARKALDPPQCASTAVPVSISFVVHGVGPCDTLRALVERLQQTKDGEAAIKQIIILNGCESEIGKLEGGGVEISDTFGLSEVAAFTKGVEKVTSDIACLMRDDEVPVADPLWVSHFMNLFAHNKQLGMTTCASGVNLERVRSFKYGQNIGAQWQSEYQDVRHGDDCCSSYHCGASADTGRGSDWSTVLPADVEQNWNATHFAYMPPVHCSPMVIRKQAWLAVGTMQPADQIDWEIDLQYRLYGNGYAVGVTDCNSFTTDCAGCVKVNSEHNYSDLWKSSGRYAASRAPFASKLQTVSWHRKSDMAKSSKLDSNIETANKRLAKKYLFDKYPLSSVTYPALTKPPNCPLPSFETDKDNVKCTAILVSSARCRHRWSFTILTCVLSNVCTCQMPDVISGRKDEETGSNTRHTCCSYPSV
jgi:hypothetical protein